MGDLYANILKCVVFVGFHHKTWDEIVTVGTAFILGFGRPDQNGKIPMGCLVTARHVLSGIKNRGASEIYLRFNLESGGSCWRKTLVEDWTLPDDSSVDVACYHAKLPAGIDHLALTVPKIGEEKLPPYPAEITDEVVVACLFSPYRNEKRLTPLLRTATIISLAKDGEAVSTPVGDFPAHLLEMKSIAGMSGAPVLMKAGLKQLVSGVAKSGDPAHYLLGLVSGHFVERGLSISPENDAEKEVKVDINAGVAFVTPSNVVSKFAQTSKPSDGKVRMYFPSDTNLAPGSFFNAMRFLTTEEIKIIEKNRTNIRIVAEMGGDKDGLHSLSPEIVSELMGLIEIFPKLNAVGWDGSTV